MHPACQRRVPAWCVVPILQLRGPEVEMAKAKQTKVKGSHKDSASKNTMNPANGSGGTQELGGTGTQAQDPKRRIGQFGGAGEPPLMKK